MKNKKWYVAIPIIIIVGFLLWYFSAIVTYILVAAVLSIIGHPLVRLLNTIKFKEIVFPRALSALITLLVMFFIIFLLFWLVVPLIAKQTEFLSGISVDTLATSFQEPIKYVQKILVQYNLISASVDITQNISSQIMSVVGITQFSNFINSIVSFTSSLAVAFFAISFITFFFLKDEKLFFKMVMAATPIGYQDAVKHVLMESKRLLTRYFIGLCIDLTLVISLMTLGMWILGFKNALMIGFFVGIMNIVPYVGPIIGASIGILLGLSSNLGLDFSTQMVPLIFEMLGVFLAVNLLDAMILQPTIYSSSVKAHPLEIFLVIMMAGSIAGVPGMMLAIPSYTVLRIVAKEFFNKFYLVKSLTKNID